MIRRANSYAVLPETWKPVEALWKMTPSSVRAKMTSRLTLGRACRSVPFWVLMLVSCRLG